MGILRKDYILDKWVYYSTERKNRPRDFKSVQLKDDSKICFFCPWNTHLTPPEIGRVEYKNGWKMRWFLNKFPAVDKKRNSKSRQKKYLLEGPPYGIHEVIVETNHHRSQLADLPISHIRELLEVYKLRISYLGRQKGIKYVEIFKNHGRDAGTSLVHSHSQVMALAQIPALIKEKLNAAKKYRKCPYCEILRLESRSKRKIFETKNIIAFAPFASSFNYEAWIFPKQHKKFMDELDEGELTDLAVALKKLLVKLKKVNVSYNFYIHYSPEKESLHFHIVVAPRIATYGGFELSTNAVINSVMPEEAARFYKG